MFELTPYDIHRFIRFKIWRRLDRLSQAVHLLPVLAGVAIALLLAFAGQLQEVYYDYSLAPMSPAGLPKILLGLVAIALLSGELFFSNFALSNVRINVLYSEHGNPQADASLRRLRAIMGATVAACPWLGLGAGLLLSADAAHENGERLAALLKSSPPFPDIQATASVFQVLGSRLLIEAAAVTALGAAVVLSLHIWRRSRLPRWCVLLAMLAFVVLQLAIPALVEALTTNPQTRALRVLGFDPVTALRWMGPLAAICIAAGSVYGILAVVSLLSAEIGFPLIPATLVLALVVTVMQWPVEVVAGMAFVLFGLLALLGLLARQWALLALSMVLALLAGSLAVHDGGRNVRAKGVIANSAPNAQPAARLKDQFTAWLEARTNERQAYAQAGKPYPIFIVAAQGGGIYAAAAAEAFLSGMQSTCGNFGQHLFAISAVSGGALGSSLFQGGMVGGVNDRGGCAQPHPSKRPSARLVIDDDHLSPLLGFLIADVLGLYTDRAHALEQSFVQSARVHGLPRDLDGLFSEHWDPARAAPALILNTTWVETGNRVAFAPFELANVSDGTLFSHRDKAMLESLSKTMTVAQALTMSARFPGIVPSYAAGVVGAEGNAKSRVWNFVDGGYADGSGAATALDIYRALNRMIPTLTSIDGQRPAIPNEVLDVRLILLTSAEPSQDFSRVSGNAGRDTLAPAITLFHLRDLLARQAVTRAIAEKGPSNAPDQNVVENNARQGSPLGWTTAVVELDDEAFKLPLGWKLSQPTHDLISVLMGRAQLCPAGQLDGAQPLPTNGQDYIARIKGNSCVSQSLAKLLSLEE